MSRWRTVAICDDCWRIEEPLRSSVRLVAAEVEECYRCGAATGSGIYVRRLVVEESPP